MSITEIDWKRGTIFVLVLILISAVFAWVLGYSYEKDTINTLGDMLCDMEANSSFKYITTNCTHCSNYWVVCEDGTEIFPKEVDS